MEVAEPFVDIGVPEVLLEIVCSAAHTWDCAVSLNRLLTLSRDLEVSIQRRATATTSPEYIRKASVPSPCALESHRALHPF